MAKTSNSTAKDMKFGAKLSHPNGKIRHISSVLEMATFTVPDAFDFDDTHPGIQMSVFGNDEFGDCVIAARANHTLRIAYKQGFVISTDEVVNEYKTENAAENGGTFIDSNGLDLGDSLARWQVMGWTAGEVTNRKIQSYYRVSWQDRNQVSGVLYSKVGLQIRLSLPDGLNIEGNYGPGHPWNSVDAPGANGHAILLTGYDTNGPIGITWGCKQSLSWEFLTAYCTDAYAVIPDSTTLKSMKETLSTK